MERHDIERAISDIITGRPQPFMAGEMHCALYPQTLAKRLIVGGLLEKLGLGSIKGSNPYAEIMNLVKKDKMTCCLILAFHATPNTYNDLCDIGEIERKKKHFAEKITDESLAEMLILTLTSDTTEQISEHLGISKERERLSEVMKIKQSGSKNSLTFGGKSIFGNFIAPLKEMGFSDNEIIFERSYSYLQLMLADKVTQVYLSDEELQRLPTSKGGQMFDANDPASKKAILAYMKSKGVGINKEQK